MALQQHITSIKVTIRSLMQLVHVQADLYFQIHQGLAVEHRTVDMTAARTLHRYTTQ